MFLQANWDKEMCVEEDHHKVEYDIFSLDGKSGPHHSPIEQSYQANAFKVSQSVIIIFGVLVM